MDVLVIIAVLALAIIVGGLGFTFRLGHMRKLAWAYVDPSWARSRFYANAMFIMIPGACMFGFGAAIALAPAESTIGMWFAILSFVSALWLFATLIYPPKFLKPKWIRDFDQEVKEGDGSLERRMEVLREIGHKSR